MDFDPNLTFLPLKLRNALMPFQKEGVQFGITKDGRCLIADEMGLGKTIQAISIAYFFRYDWPALIVVPSSLRYPWLEEIEKWLPEINPHDINLIQSGTDIGNIAKSLITVTTFGLLRHPASKVVQEALINQKFKVIIVDESHYMKNRKTATTKFLIPLLQEAEHRILLTGTPALARPEELYPQLCSIEPKLFKNWTQFANRYCDAHYQWMGRIKKWVTDGASNLEELQEILCRNVMIRRLKKDVLTQLPAKQRQRIPFELKESQLKKDLDNIWEELDKVLQRNNSSVRTVLQNGAPKSQDEGGGGGFEVFKCMSQLYMATCTAKIGPVKDYVKMLCDNDGLKFIVFAHHHVMMNSLSEQLMESSIKFIRIDGTTVQQDRPRLVHQFQNDASTRVAVLSMKAAGVGLTLTAANLVVFAELDWTPGTMEQCEDRAHRIGQTQTVHVHYLVAKGTLDEWVWSALARKTTVITTTLNGEKQVLRMDEGNQGQIDVLANADAFVPTEKSFEDISAFFQSQQGSSQKTIKDFFTPKGSKAVAKSSRAKSLFSDKESEIIISPGLEDFHSHAKKRKKVNTDMNNTFDDDITMSTNNVENDSGSVTNENNVIVIDDDDDMPIVEPLKKKKKVQAKSVVDHCENSNSSNQWACSRCTFLNHVEISTCEMCSAPKQSKNISIRKSMSPSPVKRKFSVKKSSILSPFDLAKTKALIEKEGTAACEQPKTKASYNGDTGANTAPTANQRSSIRESSDCDSSNRTCASTKCENSTLIDTIVSVARKTHSMSDSESESEDVACISSKLQRKSFQIFSQDSDPENCDEASTSAVCVVDSQNSNCSDASADLFDSPQLNSLLESKSSEDSCDISEKEEHCQSIDDICSDDHDTKTLRANSANISDTGGTPENKSRRLKSQEALKSSSPNTTNASPATPVGKFKSKFSFKRTPTMKNSLHGSLRKNYDIHSANASLNAIEMVDKRPGMNAAGTSLSSVTSNSVQMTPPRKKPEESGVVAEELAAAQVLFSPKKVPSVLLSRWRCESCDNVNSGDAEDCDGCLESKPDNPQIVDEEVSRSKQLSERTVDLDAIATHDIFQFSCSKNTSRIYLYDQQGYSLEVNFVPLDVELENYSGLPDLLLHPHNLKVVKRFVREWNTLSATKKRIVVKSGEIFVNPVRLYEDLKSGKSNPCKQRYITKADVGAASMSKAENVGGSVRIIQRPSMPHKSKNNTGNTPSKDTTPKDKIGEEIKKISMDENDLQKIKGIVQALDKDGNPLCVFCHKPYKNGLIAKETVDKNPWMTRFCSNDCMENYWLRTHRGYSRQQVFELEHGICQLCGIDADNLFKRIRSATDHKRRAKLLKESTFNQLKSDVKERMVKTPQAGLFWHVDHIKAVSEGGGECDIDNLRTLCTVCHRDVTAQQNKERRQKNRLKAAAGSGDISLFFKPR